MAEHQSTPEREAFFEFAGDARLMAAEIVKHRAEIDRWKAQAFAPLGDNHHNALLCPHCNPEGRRFA